MSLFRSRLMIQANRLIDGIDFSAQPNNEVWYVTTDGNTYSGIETMGWGAQVGLKLVSNTYKNGIGRAVYNTTIETIGENFARFLSQIKIISLPRKVKYLHAYSLGYGELNVSASLVFLSNVRIGYSSEFKWNAGVLYVQKGLAKDYAEMKSTHAGQDGIKEIKEINI